MSAERSRTDFQIQRAIIGRLTGTPTVAAEQLAVAITDGAVTVGGEVRTEAERQTALRVCRDVAAADALVDQIEVGDRGEVTDATIARHIQRLLAEPAMKDVFATVNNGIVVLEGKLDWDCDRSATFIGFEAVPGIREMVDRLGVRPVPHADEVRATVRAALHRAADVTVEHLSVMITGHTATLQGCVHSTYDRRAAEEAAYTVSGVTEVVTNLSVWG